MPLVFVHGVNVRKGPVYEKETAFRDKNFIEIFYRELGRTVGQNAIFNPYWGDHGAKLSPDNPFLPKGNYEMLWAPDGHEQTLPCAILDSGLIEEDSENPFLELALKSSLSDVVDLLLNMASEEGKTSDPAGESSADVKDSASDFAKMAYKIIEFSESTDTAAWLRGVKTDHELFEKLESLLLKETKSEHASRTRATMIRIRKAATGFNSRLSDARGRLRKRIKDARLVVRENMAYTHQKIKSKTVGTAAKIFFDPIRALFHQQFSLLIGDSFLYFSDRTDNDPGAIGNTILEGMRQAAAARSPADPELIVVGHSMGGIILCDLVTHYGRDIDIDILITVGSQYPLFADLEMFPGIKGEHRPIPIPANVKCWINIFDPHDFLGYPASHLFQGVDDYHLPSGTMGGRAHMDYFNRRSFYGQLARRIKEKLLVRA